MTAAALLSFELARPAALFALLLPFAVLLVSRLDDRPVEVATGTLDLWERVRASLPPRGRARRRIPPAVWMLALGLALGALALAGPRTRGPEATRSFRALVDASPSMSLPMAAGTGAAGAGGASGTRRDRAVALAREWLERTQPGARVEWIDRTRPFGPEDDEADALWVTDRAPSPAPRRAGFFASGGPAVPGPIAVDGSTRFDWDGARIVEVPGGAPERRVEVQGVLPPPIVRFLDAWAGARGVVIGAKGGDRPALVLHGAESSSAAAPAPFEAGRDGWTATGAAIGSAPSADRDGPLETWLADGGGRALVTWGAGRVHCPWTSMDDPRGDPAAFAVSWAELFDHAELAPAGVVELAERTAAGDEKMQAPISDASTTASSPGLWPSGLGGIAFLCVAAAWLLSSRRASVASVVE